MSSNAQDEYQLVIIGGGPGGVTAARTAALQGWRVALVSGGPLMGYGLDGAFKSKSMYEIARTYHAVQNRWKLLRERQEIDFGRVYKANAQGAEDIRVVHRSQLVSLGVEIIEGMAHFRDPHTIEVRMGDNGALKTIVGERFIVATGTTPRMLPGVEADGRQIMISDDIVELDRRPESILILGAG
ncbi:MAG: FAD-dependent oxidoreductase, partial [Myxococcota bacterium]